MPRSALFIVHTILSLGLNLLIERLNLDPRWKYLVIGLIVLNEIRGVWVVFESGQFIGWW